MRQRALVGVFAMLVGLAFVGVGCGGAMSTPEGTFETFKKAQLNDDYGLAWDCLSKNSQKFMDEMFKMMEGIASMDEEGFKKDTGMASAEFAKLSPKDKFVQVCKSKGQKEEGKQEKDKIRNTVIVEKRIEGDKATLKIKSGDEEDEMALVKEDGLWKLEMESR